MRYASRIKPVSYLKANAAEVLHELAEQREPMIITQNGEAKAVIQDIGSYEQTQETPALLKIETWTKSTVTSLAPSRSTELSECLLSCLASLITCAPSLIAALIRLNSLMSVFVISAKLSARHFA